MRYSFLLVFFLSLATLSAQRTVTGTVVDAKDGAPLPYVNVFLAGNQSRGVLTNEDGEYELQLATADANDELVFSLLSYETVRRPVAEALAKGFANVRLQSSYLSLDEIVVISDLGLKNLLRKAVAAIPNNYDTEPYLLRAYSRRYDIDSDTFSLYAEAMLNIRQRRIYQEGDRIEARIEQYRGEEADIMTIRDRWPLMDSPYGLLANYTHNENIARTGRFLKSWVGFSKEEVATPFFDKMTFANRGEYLQDGDTIIRISYQLNPELLEEGLTVFGEDGVNAFYAGEIAVNKSNLAIISYRRGDKELITYSEITYQRRGAKYYPYRMSTSTRFDYEYDTRTYFQSEELFVTEVITDPKAIKKAYRGKPLTAAATFADITVRYDADFWAQNDMLIRRSAPEQMRFLMERMQRAKTGEEKNPTPVKSDSARR